MSPDDCGQQQCVERLQCGRGGATEMRGSLTTGWAKLTSASMRPWRSHGNEWQDAETVIQARALQCGRGGATEMSPRVQVVGGQGLAQRFASGSAWRMARSSESRFNRSVLLVVTKVARSERRRLFQRHRAARGGNEIDSLKERVVIAISEKHALLQWTRDFRGLFCQCGSRHRPGHRRSASKGHPEGRAACVAEQRIAWRPSAPGPLYL